MRRVAPWWVAAAVGIIAASWKPAEVVADEIAGTLWSRAAAAEQAEKLEVLLSAWSSAGQANRLFDAKFTCWTYDSIFGDDKQPKVTYGRVLFQRHGASRYEVAGRGSFFWRDDEYSIIDREKGEYRRYGKINWEAVLKTRRGPPPEELGWWQRFAREWARAWACAEFVHPTDVVPYLQAGEMAELRADYDLTLETTTTDVRIWGRRKPDRQARFESVSFAFRGGVALPYAMRVELTDKTVVHEFQSPWLYRQAPDAETFLNPDLSGLKRIDMEAEEKAWQESREKITGKPAPTKKPR